MKLKIFCFFVFFSLSLQVLAIDLFVTSNRTCSNKCIGNLANPFDNLLFALGNASLMTTHVRIILLGDSSTEHYVLSREQDPLNATSFLYEFSDLLTFTLLDVEISPLFCDETIVQTNIDFLNKCINRNQKIVLVLKSMQMTLKIKSKLLMQNIIIDWSESSQSIISNDSCTQNRKRCCVASEGSSGEIECDPKYYTNQPTTYRFIELDGEATNPTGITRFLAFESIEIKNVRDKALKNFVKTDSLDPFELIFQNSIINDISFGQGLIGHIGTGIEDKSSSIKIINVNFTNYNYWNREYQTDFNLWNEGYLLFADSNFKGTISISESNFADFNSASMFYCPYPEEIDDRGYASSDIELYPVSRSNIWSRYHYRNSNQESSLIYITRFDGEMTIRKSTFQKIIGLFGSVIQIKDCSESTHFSFLDSKFDDNFGMQGFANMIIVAKPTSDIRASSEIRKCPLIEVKNCQFSNSKGCPGSYGNIGFICYWNSDPDAPILSARDDFDAWGASTSLPIQIKVSQSNFQNNLIPISNSLAIVGSYHAHFSENNFQDNGGTTAEIIIYSLMDSNFYEKKPDYLGIKNAFPGLYFAQSTVVHLDRIFMLESINNTYQGNWGPWEGSQVLAAAITIRTWFPFRSNSLFFKDDVFKDHSGIPSHINEYLEFVGWALRDNPYLPPLIAIYYESYNYPYDNVTKITPDILFDGVKFINNTMTYDVMKVCEYGYLNNLCSIMKSRRRYLVGFVKFLTLAEQLEEGTIDYVANTFIKEMDFSMINTKIINNTLTTEGCLFPTLLAWRYFLNNVTIQENRINPSSLTESPEYREPSLDWPLQTRDGMFCGFQKESLKVSKPKIIFSANQIQAENNVGIIFNLYPQEPNTWLILNSIFKNNTCAHGSLIHVFEESKIVSINNIFLENDNFLGNSFITTLGTSYYGILNTYAKNNGKHASLAYINDRSMFQEILLKSYWNTVSPAFQNFADKLTPQGGLYFTQSVKANFLMSNFKENYAYAGYFVSLKSIISLNLANVSDNYINGGSLIGNFFSSALNIKQIRFFNNSISPLSSLETIPSMIILITSQLNADNLEIINTLVKVNQASFVRGTNMQGVLNNISITNFHTFGNNAALIRLEHSNVLIQDLVCNNITSVFKLFETKIVLRDISIEKLLMKSSSDFLINMVDSTIDINGLEYTGGFDSGNYLTLFTGSGNDVRMVRSRFLKPLEGINIVFGLVNTISFFIARSEFYYVDSDSQTTIFNLISGNGLKIQECIFILSGQIIQANNIDTTLYFVKNIILTNSHKQNIKLYGNNVTYFINNYILGQNTSKPEILPETQIEFLNNFGSLNLQSNCFLSLYGSKGIFKVQSSTIPYNVTSKENLFLDNTGSRGGTFHIDAQLSTSSLSPPSMTIENSIFVLNKAINIENEKGKGGAIYQTTLTSTKQITILKGNFFFKNSAEAIGGAIYFDYFPPQMDSNSIFRENYASRPNHIGSYPVKLVFYGVQSPVSEPYIPNQRSFQELTNNNESSFYKWENIASGVLVNRTYIFGLVDMFGQIVYDDNSSLLELYPNGLTEDNRYLFSSKLSVAASNGIYVFNNFNFMYKIDEYLNVTFTSSAIQKQRKLSLQGVPLTLSASVQINIYFRKCGPGEYVLKKDNSTTCVECQPGFWQTSSIPNIPFCKPCIEESTICLGGNNVGPRQGYWRLNQSADVVLECPISSSCLGNSILQSGKDDITLDPVGLCAHGYKGNLCSNCIPGWAKTGTGTCTNCETDTLFYVRVAVTIIFQLVVVIQGFRGSMILCKEYSESKVIKLNGAILIRILTNYLQLISLVSKIPVTWPTAFKNVTSTLSDVSSVNENIFTIDCMFSSNQVFGIRLVFIKLLIGSAGGSFLAFMSLIFWIIYYIIKRRKIIGNKSFVSKLVTTVIVICFMMQPSAIQSSFSFFQCDNLYREDDPISYFSKDYDVKCWEGEHLYWTLGLGLPSLIIWSFILPFVVFNAIRKNRDRLTTQEVAQKFSFLYGGYTSQRYYWELIIMGRKFMFIAVIISASFHSTDLEIYISIILIILFYLIQMIGLPFSDPQMNVLERLSLISAAAINFCGLYFQLVNTTPGLDITVIVIGFTANLVFWIAFIRLYFIIQIQKIKENNKKVYNIIIKVVMKLDSCCFKRKKLQKTLTKMKIIEFKAEDVLQQPEQPEEIARLGLEVQSCSPLNESPERKLEIISNKINSKHDSQIKDDQDFLSFEDILMNAEKSEVDDLDFRSDGEKHNEYQQAGKNSSLEEKR